MLILLPIAGVQVAVASSAAVPVTHDAIAAIVSEASQRFGIPERWISAVMARESDRNPVAISTKGALGLMQLMPSTWQILRARLDLGPDPFDPHDNIIAGTAYLRALYDRYGVDGFLAAYNAGPGRYEDWLKTGRPLPHETMLYVARLMSMTALADAGSIHLAATPIPVSWQQSALFTTKYLQVGGNSAGTAVTPPSTPFAAVSPTPGSDDALPPLP